MDTDPRFRDDLPESPVDWQDIQLGPGQTPSAFTHLQFTKEGDAFRQTDVRRDPDNMPPIIIHRYPERPY